MVPIEATRVLRDYGVNYAEHTALYAKVGRMSCGEIQVVERETGEMVVLARGNRISGVNYLYWLNQQKDEGEFLFDSNINGVMEKHCRLSKKISLNQMMTVESLLKELSAFLKISEMEAKQRFPKMVDEPWKGFFSFGQFYGVLSINLSGGKDQSLRLIYEYDLVTGLVKLVYEKEIDEVTGMKRLFAAWKKDNK